MYLILVCLLAIGANFNAEAFKDPLVSNGRSVMIHLFEWKWTE